MNTFKRIIAATDLSDCATVALSYAKAIARKFDAELTLVHANVIAPITEGVPADLAYTAVYQLEGARAALDQYAARHLAGVRNAQKLVVTGAAPDVILSTARNDGADLIVMGTRGASGIRRLVLGSVAEAVTRRSDIPVLTVQCDLPEASSETALFRRILCPVHYDRTSGAAFERAVPLAASFDAELIVVYVAEESPGVLDVDMETERLRTWAGGMTTPAKLKLLVDRGNAAEQIISYAKQHRVDLIVAGSRRKGSVLGSTTEMLTRNAPCPVLTVPVNAER